MGDDVALQSAMAGVEFGRPDDRGACGKGRQRLRRAWDGGQHPGAAPDGRARPL